jgi:DNA helicase IV
VLVIEGGPGTGKTVVALHRVAYLLYHHRDRLARRGVLLIGPNAGFLRYVGQVLPSLGETDVVFATPGEVLPGVAVTAEDGPAARRVKGSAVMVDVLSRAIADTEILPDRPIPIELDDITVPLDAEVAEAARTRARNLPLRHNEAVGVFRAAVIEALTARAVARIGSGWLDTRGGETERLTTELTDDVRAELVTSPELDLAVRRLWPTLTAQRLLGRLLTDPDRLASAAAGLPAVDREALLRTEPEAWTVADVPLLDEAIEQLGRDDSAERARQRRQEREERAYAEGVLEILDTEEDPDGEVLRAVDLIDSAAMAERQTEVDTRDLAERAAADREWTYGHVVVDEAQELSAMDWRVLMRRCPSRSMTVVGDLAQRQSPAGARSWAEVLEPHVPGRWSHRPLTVNYRTPAEVMAVAADVLAELDPALRPPESVRAAGSAPWVRRVEPADLVEAATEAVLAELAELGQGTAAILAPAGHPVLRAPVTGVRPAAVLTAQQAKGLEYDVVVVLEPAELIERDPQGLAALYVALTRTTQRLGVLHTGDLPAALAGLTAR